MDKSLHLDNRLSLCADFVRKGVKVADIGTDHAYLPVWLCKSSTAVQAVAADINPKPLQRGKETVVKYNAENMVQLRLSNGLENIQPDEADDIIIAGMGGELISGILNAAPWVKNSRYHFILQPMTKAEVLREYLYENGFEIEAEKATEAEGKIYSVMSVYYTGNKKHNIGILKYYGRLSPKDGDCAKSYIAKAGTALLKKGRGILTSNCFSSDGKKYEDYGNQLTEYAEGGAVPKNKPTVQEIYSFIDSFAPFDTALDYDNAGILVGDSNGLVQRVLVALDITPEVVAEAAKLKANLIVSHHPVIFKPVRQVKNTDAAYMLAQKDINAICAHTNLDLSPKGVNICMANALGLKDVTLDSEGIAVGNIDGKALSSRQLAQLVKEKLHCTGVRFTDIKNKIKRVAVGGGACGEYIYLARELGAEAFVTGEIKHNYILESHSINLTVIDAGHYRTEDVVVDFLVKELSAKFKDTEFIKSKVFTDYIDYI